MAAPIAPAQVPSSAGHDLDLVERRRPDPPPHLGPDRVEQQVAGRRDPAADDDPVGRDDRDHVGDADPEVAADLGQPGQRPRVAGPGRCDRLLGRRRPAGRGDPVGPRERLETAAVAAAARRPVRVDRLVADLAGRAVVAEMDPAVDGDDAADAGAERQPDHRATRRGPPPAAAPPARTPGRR